MTELSSTLNSALLVTQFIAALVGCVYFFKLKENYWKWFSVYLVVIFIQEYFLTHTSIFSLDIKNQYNLFIGMPLEFIFLYWLYAHRSLNNKKLFLLFSIVLILSILFISSMSNFRTAISLILNVGSLLLIILVILEFIKQIRNDDILKFKENKMFYINLGVVLFYFGSLPFHVFQKYLYQDYTVFIEYYYLYFLTANCIMYLLFTASFIWGKERT
jgi:hypothetical protein